MKDACAWLRLLVDASRRSSAEGNQSGTASEVLPGPPLGRGRPPFRRAAGLRSECSHVHDTPMNCRPGCTVTSRLQRGFARLAQGTASSRRIRQRQWVAPAGCRRCDWERTEPSLGARRRSASTPCALLPLVGSPTWRSSAGPTPRAARGRPRKQANNAVRCGLSAPNPCPKPANGRT